ncbi:MAG TPA: ABC transporter ATP-binding protein [Rhizomicrobium sp.]|nr:ABC transporter ATP-binding protein [Rhizomicrobium sp.]
MTSAASGAPLLKVDGATIQYETDDSVVVAVWRVSFSVQKGERLMILGRSGCGKSTLLKAIGGYLLPVEGSIALAGVPVSRPGPDRMIVWQDTDQLLPWKTARQNVLYPMRLNGVSAAEARDRADTFIEMVGLTRAAEQYPHQLSGGMKMRVAVARGLAMKPAILLMDEPFAALDALTRQHMQEELLRLQQETGATVIFVTHDIAEAAALGTRVIVMSPFPGQIKANLDVSRFASHEELAATINRVVHDDDDDKKEIAA